MTPQTFRFITWSPCRHFSVLLSSLGHQSFLIQPSPTPVPVPHLRMPTIPLHSFDLFLSGKCSGLDERHYLPGFVLMICLAASQLAAVSPDVLLLSPCPQRPSCGLPDYHLSLLLGISAVLHVGTSACLVLPFEPSAFVTPPFPGFPFPILAGSSQSSCASSSTSASLLNGVLQGLVLFFTHLALLI